MMCPLTQADCESPTCPIEGCYGMRNTSIIIVEPFKAHLMQFSRPELAHLITELQTALNNIRDITGDTHRDRPYTALSLIDQIARKALTI